MDHARDLLAKDLKSTRRGLHAEIRRGDRERSALTEQLESADIELGDRIADVDLARRKVAKDLVSTRSALVKRIREVDAERARLADRLWEESIRLDHGIAGARRIGSAGLANSLRLHTEFRAVKLHLLYAGHRPEGKPLHAKPVYPNEEHFAFLGIVHEYLDTKVASAFGLDEGQGVRIRRIAYRSPAHDSDLYRGDIILRANGVPVKSSGLMRPRPVVSPWEERNPMPDFLTSHLPGEPVELEYVRNGVVRKARIRLSCQTDEAECPFANMWDRK